MQIDLPHDLPRRQTEAPKSPPLEPSPVERRRERLAARAEDRRGSGTRSRRDRGVPKQRPREPKGRKITREQPQERRTRRNDIPQKIVGLSLRNEEIKALTAIGKFRVVSTRDLAENVYGDRCSELQRDLRFLQEKGVVEVNSVNARRDGRGGKVERIEVVTLTKPGQDLVREVSGLPPSQKLYYGMVKPREVEHDTQIYRAYLKEAERIEQKGGTNLRVQLDFELKSKVQKAIHAERKTDPKRDMAEIKQKVAEHFELPIVKGKIQIPDARIEYDLPRDVEKDPTSEPDQGSRTGHEDIEVLTAAYRPGHLRAKAQAGFRAYASPSDRATLTSKIEDDHHLMENILEL
ncbi:MAG TPA: hypothetical protein VK638_23875 [Edaphobacter sp.]|nr:hypothetical protein [Edaphobacter sp.]